MYFGKKQREKIVFEGQTSGPSDLQFCDGTSAQTVSPAATVTTVPENSGFLISPEDIFTDTTVSCTVSAPRDVVLPYEVPQVKSMYGCTATAMGMLLGYYDRYGYLGYNVSNLIKGDVELNARDYSGSIPSIWTRTTRPASISAM